MTFASLLLAAVTVLPAQDGTGSVWGLVRSRSSNAPLAFATIEIIGAGLAPLQAQTNGEGRYYLRNVPAGRRFIRVTHIDHAPEEIEIVIIAGRTHPVSFDLELRPVRLRPVRARAGPLMTDLRDTTSARPTDLGNATVRALEATPGVAELGLAEAAREVPGHEPIDPSDVLFVRGGSADLKLVLLNGAPVFAPFHIGGLIHPVDGDLFRSATLYLGGAPARYNGGLSYVMDLETRSGRPTGLHGNVAVDLLSARGVVEGPVPGRGTVVLGARGVHGRGAEPFFRDPFPYSYGDAVGRMDFDLAPGKVLSMSGFWNRESVRMDSLTRPEENAAWGNTAGSLRLRSTVGKSDGLFTVAAGQFGARLPVGSSRRLMTGGVSRQIRASADFGRSVGSSRLSYGASFDRVDFSQRVWVEQGEVDSTLYRDATSGSMAGAYIDAATNPLERVQLRAGLRGDVFTMDGGVALSPRIAITLLVTDRVSATVAAGRYRQYVRTTEEPLALITTPQSAQGETQHLTVASSTHLTMALDQDLGENVRLSLEGFYKTFDGLPSTGGVTAEASGVDLWVRRNKGELVGWFGYSLAWVWSDHEDPNHAMRFFDGRQLMTAGLSGPLIGKGKFDVRVSYGAGLPFAAIPEPEANTPVIGVGLADVPAFSMVRDPSPSVPNAPDQPYIRIDAQLARTWHGDWRGFAFEFTPYVKVLNALNRRDGIFYYYERGGSADARALAGLPLLPVVGVDWRF
jgi:hypothetical protein